MYAKNADKLTHMVLQTRLYCHIVKKRGHQWPDKHTFGWIFCSLGYHWVNQQLPVSVLSICKEHDHYLLIFSLICFFSNKAMVTSEDVIKVSNLNSVKST